MNLQGKHFYAFGPFRLDCEKRVLVREGVPVPLGPKVAETLVALVENAGRLVDKDHLMKRVWPDAFVEEGNLNKNIFVLRKVLGQLGEDREYIETVPKRGYRFVAPVNEVTHAEISSQPQSSTGNNLLGKKISHYRILAIVGGGGMGLVFAKAGFFTQSSSPTVWSFLSHGGPVRKRIDPLRSVIRRPTNHQENP